MTTLDLVAGCLIVGFVVILLIYFLLKLKKKEPFSPAEKQMPFFIMGALLIYVVLLAIRYSTGISNTDRLQILLQLGLVTITAVYAWSARQQSEANAKMAEEMKKQTAATIRPMVIARYHRSVYNQNTKSLEIDFEALNVGAGVALNIRAQFKLSSDIVKTLSAIRSISQSHGQEQIGYLAPGESIYYKFSHVLTDSTSIESHLILLYQDVVDANEKNHEWQCTSNVKWQYTGAADKAWEGAVHFAKLERVEQVKQK